MRLKKINGLILGMFGVILLSAFVTPILALPPPEVTYNDGDGDVWVANVSQVGSMTGCTGPRDDFDHCDIINITWLEDFDDDQYNFTIEFNGSLNAGELITDQMSKFFFDVNGTLPAGPISSDGFASFTAENESSFTFYLHHFGQNDQFRVAAAYNNNTHSMDVTGDWNDNEIYFYVEDQYIDGIPNLLDIDQWRVFGYGFYQYEPEDESSHVNHAWDFINFDDFKTNWFDVECDQDEEDPDRDIAGYPSAWIIPLIFCVTAVIIAKKKNLTKVSD